MVGANITNMTINETSIEVLWQAFRLAIRDLVNVAPSILLALVIIAIYIGLAILLNRIIRRVFKLFRVDELLKPLIRQAPFSLTSLVVVLIDVGLAILALYSIVLVLFPEQVHTTTLVVYYAARVASVVFLILFVFIALEAIAERIRMEAKMRGFILFLILFLSLVPILDITALSHEVKTALAWGISIGIGLAIGVFATWFFFHEILESMVRAKKEREH